MKKIMILLGACFFLGGVQMTFAETHYTFKPQDSHHSLSTPAGAGPFPAVLILHGSEGIEKSMREWSDKLKNAGYVVYIMDSFNPRGYKDRKSVGWDKATKDQLDDVSPAVNYLTSFANVNPKKLGVLGFGMGGYNVARIMSKNSQFNFAAAATLYGVCKGIPITTPIHGPFKIFIGEKDDRADTKACQALVEKAKERNEAMFIEIYPNALHAFDNEALPASFEVIEKDGNNFHVGYNKEAKKAATKDLLSFFSHYL